MAINPIIDSRDVRFVLFEMLETDTLKNRYPQYAEQDRDVYEGILDLAERIAVAKNYPVNSESDKEGCVYDPSTKTVKIPKGYREPIKAYYDAGFLALSESEEIGGMGMPLNINIACMEMFVAGSNSMMTYPGLGHGVMMLIHNFGTDELKKTYAEKLLSGEWGGTMCLTESDAGSDVGALKTKAVKQADGTYRISGQKIFITAGDNDLYKNIIHAVLARIEGDPAGTKGISIFIVPKFIVKSDGSLGPQNDVVCAGIEHKMGIKGSATCTMSFGENGNCVGYLLGEERKGMKVMFQLMNEARIGVGIQALGISSSAYLHAVTYAKSRIQGVHITQMMNPGAKGVPIIQHPDVKRMLLYMKSHVEGMRMLCYLMADCLTLEHADKTEAGKEALALAELMLPICKSGNADYSLFVTSEAIQVYGGSGYCADYPVEQLMRESKITAIYEGTSGIQSLDLMMRKLLMNKEQYNYSIFLKRLRETIEKSRGIVDDKYISAVERGLAAVDSIVSKNKELMAGMKIMQILMNAKPFLDIMFMMSLGWLHLWSLIVSMPKMKAMTEGKKGEELDKLLSDNQEAAYYHGRVLSSQFYIGAIFPELFGKAEAVMNLESAVVKAGAFSFSGAPD